MSSESSLDLANATFIRFIATSSQPKPISYHETLCVLLAGTRKPVFASFRFGLVELSEGPLSSILALPRPSGCSFGFSVKMSFGEMKSLSHGLRTKVKLFFTMYIELQSGFPIPPLKSMYISVYHRVHRYFFPLRTALTRRRSM